MKENEIYGYLEALLFAAGEPVGTAKLARIVGLSDADTRAYLTALQEMYRDDRRGLCLIEAEDTWQLATKPAAYELIKALNPYTQKIHLSHAALETLAIIAYRQPVTRVEIETIRGVASASSIAFLLHHDLIREAGRKDAPGRPFFYETTPGFLRAAGFTDISELPPVTAFESAEEVAG